MDRPVFHVHFLTPDRVERTEKERQKYLGTEKMGLLRHVWQYQYLRKRMESGFDGEKKWKIITLTREPVGRNIATFFENLRVELSGDRYIIQSDYYGFEGIFTIGDMDKLVQLFFERLYHDRPLVYFDEELKTVFGIDVFASEFPVTKGYKIYQGEQADALLIRLESLNDCARDAFEEFLHIKDFTLINENIGSEKVYAPLYKEMKDAIILPEAYLDRMYTSKYARHFYSEEEIARFRAKWHTSGN
ncbi:MAG: putative capsular polysaccharide synthesis family protein [Chloroflexota bacterium]|nr:putative capsular polysaccharide synthesis family protein [Chloroflexota bacterium]